MDEQARARDLAEALLSGPDPRPDCRHAVVDGGRLDDAAALLRAAGIQARSLLLDAAVHFSLLACAGPCRLMVVQTLGGNETLLRDLGPPGR